MQPCQDKHEDCCRGCRNAAWAVKCSTVEIVQCRVPVELHALAEPLLRLPHSVRHQTRPVHQSAAQYIAADWTSSCPPRCSGCCCCAWPSAPATPPAQLQQFSTHSGFPTFLRSSSRFLLRFAVTFLSSSSWCSIRPTSSCSRVWFPSACIKHQLRIHEHWKTNDS